MLILIELDLTLYLDSVLIIIAIPINSNTRTGPQSAVPGLGAGTTSTASGFRLTRCISVRLKPSLPLGWGLFLNCNLAQESRAFCYTLNLRIVNY